MSKYEVSIYKILKSENINFVREKIFKDCYGGNYRFDFYLPDLNILLEVQGQQHYYFTRHFFENKSDFQKSCERDRRKISYALAHKIKIYCIPYWEIDNLKSFSDICQNKFLAKSKFHNDDVWREYQKHRAK